MSESDTGLLTLGLVAAIWYGAHQHGRAEDLQNKLETADSQIDDLKQKTSNLAEASDNLKQQLERFQSDNWRDVVPDATAAGDEVDTAKTELQSSADEAGTGDGSASD